MGSTVKRYRVEYVTAVLDVDGNPRRGWIVSTPEGTSLGFVDEGYQGRQALRDAFNLVWPDLRNPDPLDDLVSDLPDREITVKEWAGLKRLPFALAE